MTEHRPNSAAAVASLGLGALGIAVASLFANLLMLTGPLYMMQIYDRVLTSGSAQTLIALTVLVVGLYSAFSLLDAIRARMLVRLAGIYEARMAEKVFRTTTLLPLKAAAETTRSDPISDLDQIRQFISGPGPIAIFDLPWMPIYLLAIYALHPLLAGFTAAGAIVLFVLMLANEGLSRFPVRNYGGSLSRRSLDARSARAGAGAALSMGILGNLTTRWLDQTNEVLGAHQKVSDRTSAFSALTKSLRLLLQSAVLGLGAYLAINDEVTAGAIIAASIISARALAPVEQATANWRGFVTARFARQRLKKLVDHPLEQRPETDLPLPRQRLSVERLASGPAGGPLIIQGFQFQLMRGDGLGVIGPSGSGKTALARAILGLWPSAFGFVRFDGATRDQWDIDRFGQAIGYLPQETELFDGTVAQNIAQFSANPSAEDIVKAAQLANAHDMITALPKGYDNPIGERGAALSAGQRQRIGLARALYGDPFLVILDEPNANLDAEGERALTSAISKVRERGGIVIVIAHRPSAIAAVDLLLFVRNGRQEKFGPKEEVLAEVAANSAAIRNSTHLKVVADD